MSYIPSQASIGSFLPTTYILDAAAVQSLDVNSPEFKQHMVKLYQTINSMLIVLNTKDSGYYIPQEFVNSQLFFPDPALSSTTDRTPTYRQVFRKTINFGALPNATVKSVPHGIVFNGNFSATRIYGAATDRPNSSMIPIPYVSSVAGAQNIELYIDATNVNMATGSDYSMYTISYVVIEYLKQ